MNLTQTSEPKTTLIAFVRPEIQESVKVLGFDVKFVHSFDDLVSALKDGDMPIVAIDHDYSGLSTEVIGTLQALYPDSPRIILTDRPKLHMVMEFINTGAVFGFVTIPVVPGELKALVERAMMVVRSKLQHQMLLDKVRRFDSELGSLLMQRMQFLESENRQLKQQALMDPLTGCFNVRYMHYQLSLEYDKFQRYGEIFSILMLDLDDFKAINDNYGHQVGDLALEKTADVLKGSIRKSDVVIRYGGDEFMIISPNTNSFGVQMMAKRLEASLSKARIEGVEDLRLTMSVGAVTCEPGYHEGVQELIRRADRALYYAKDQGKNKFALWKDVQKQDIEDKIK